MKSMKLFANCLKQLLLKDQINITKRQSTMPFATVSFVTVPDETVARQLSKQLVEQRLAACVNIVKGVESVYEWEGKIQQDNELLLIIKSSDSKSESLSKFVQENHPYDCPEVVTLKVESGSQPYLKWIHSTLNQDPSARVTDNKMTDTN